MELLWEIVESVLQMIHKYGRDCIGDIACQGVKKLFDEIGWDSKPITILKCTVSFLRAWIIPFNLEGGSTVLRCNEACLWYAFLLHEIGDFRGVLPELEKMPGFEYF